MSQLKLLNKRYVAVDNNVPALCATKQKNGTTYIFYYKENHEIAYLTGADVSDYAEKTVKVADSSGKSQAVNGSNSPVTATTWNDEIRFYYIDSDKRINELCLGSDGKWFYGMLTDKKYKASSHSGLYAAGNAEYEKDGGNISLLFMDGDNDNNLTQASINVTTRKWEKEVVTN